MMCLKFYPFYSYTFITYYASKTKPLLILTLEFFWLHVYMIS